MSAEATPQAAAQAQAPAAPLAHEPDKVDAKHADKKAGLRKKPAAATKVPAPAAPAPAAADAAEEVSLPLAGEPVLESHKVKDVHVSKKLQARLDTDPGQVVDVGRCESFAVKMKAGEKFPPIKCVRCSDAPGFKKGEKVLVCFDGMHTHGGAEIAKIAEIECLVWDGTWAQALYAAGTVANREHENNGKPLSTKEKIHRVTIIADAYKSAVAKSLWPSNRKLADEAGVSHQHVNNMDPFGRSTGDKREARAALQRASRNVAKLATPGAHFAGPSQLDPVTGEPANFEIVQKTTGVAVARYKAGGPEKAMDRFKSEFKDRNAAECVARDFTPDEAILAAQQAAKNGTARPLGFDWVGVDGHLGVVIRGLDAMGDLFGLKGTPEYKAAFGHINAFAEFFKGVRQKHGTKKAAS